MNGWLLKTEPDEYSFERLLQDGRTVWSGVSNALALIHLRNMRKGDKAIVYHTGGAKCAIGLARVASDPYPDPRVNDPRIVVVDVEPLRKLKKPVGLEAVRRDPALRDFPLVKMPRLSVMPVKRSQWRSILRMAGE